MRLIEVTPEGRIVASLLEGPKTYGELRSSTGLSDRWLSVKLRELTSAGVVDRVGRVYRLREPSKVLEDPVFVAHLRESASLRAKARLIAEELGRDERVLAVVLFGSVSRGQAREDSDVDLLVVTDVEAWRELSVLVQDLMLRYDVPVEALFMTLDDLLVNLAAGTALILGVLEGYEVLLDRAGIGPLLSVQRGRLLREWTYDEVAGTWVRAEVLSRAGRRSRT